MREKEKDKDAVESHAPKKRVRSLFRKKELFLERERFIATYAAVIEETKEMISQMRSE